MEGGELRTKTHIMLSCHLWRTTTTTKPLRTWWSPLSNRVDRGSRSHHKHPPEGEITIMITMRLQSQPQGHSEGR